MRLLGNVWKAPPTLKKIKDSVKQAAPYQEEVGVPIRGFPNNKLILPGNRDMSLYQALLLVILSYFLLERLPAYLYLLFFWASFLDK